REPDRLPQGEASAAQPDTPLRAVRGVHGSLAHRSLLAVGARGTCRTSMLRDAPRARPRGRRPREQVRGAGLLPCTASSPRLRDQAPTSTRMTWPAPGGTPNPKLVMYSASPGPNRMAVGKLSPSTTTVRDPSGSTRTTSPSPAWSGVGKPGFVMDSRTYSRPL